MDSNGVFAPNMRRVPTGELIQPSRKTNGAGVQAEDTRICVVMVGLPARGKSLIAQKGKSFSSPEWRIS
jgi:6-phosphofructo-2-kinase/fructose-2,6-biphosphatase 2